MKVVTEKTPLEMTAEKPLAKDGKVLLWKDGQWKAFFPIDAQGALANGWLMNKPEEKQEAKPEAVTEEVKPVAEVKAEVKVSKKKSR